ncbi:MAG: hypothetical protein U9Q84_08800 [Thermodesulfobacteriota bacterium]|nr:hypothetical protein [Thermodesulfobacteriota bacterium]
MISSDQKKKCAEKIRERLGLEDIPQIEIIERPFRKLKNSTRYKLEESKGIVESAEYYCKENYFDSSVTDFRSEYRQLSHDTDNSKPFDIRLIEVRVKLGTITTSAGFNWIIIGNLRDSTKYCAIICIYVRELFRLCGISTLLKMKEIQLAGGNGCSFIQTYHVNDNPDFVAAIVPGLRNDFLLYHGKKAGGEQYEEDGYIHLRRYFDNEKHYSNVTIQETSGTIISPDQNAVIIDFLSKTKKKYPGRIIKKIESWK